ncbi:MAG: hypothetical protein COA78_03830 [Blastopirellula sp.]|nr:MAG: hypothetical protein COA78_03830 [Blastopirellula sp.]
MFPGSLFLYAIPLILVISLVYAGTRHELKEPILHHAFDTFKWILGFMMIVGLVIAGVTMMV